MQSKNKKTLQAHNTEIKHQQQNEDKKATDLNFDQIWK